jgi:hypothetical protein
LNNRERLTARERERAGGLRGGGQGRGVEGKGIGSGGRTPTVTLKGVRSGEKTHTVILGSGFRV